MLQSFTMKTAKEKLFFRAHKLFISAIYLFILMNERVTEEIVRAHFRDYLRSGDAIWEQIPDNARIRKCLNHLSKQGDGKGRPEFIIAPAHQSDFLIVVECKANPAHHSNNGHYDAVKFAVDGALHYARYLSAEFNVLAIAVSVAPPAPRISHFWLFQGEKKGEPCFSNELLSLNDYCRAYKDHGKALNQDLNKLLAYTKRLSDTLKQQIKLPVDKAGKPDFALMENYIKSLPFSAVI